MEESANKTANAVAANSVANRKEYMRELMRKKRAAEKVRRASVEVRSGEIDVGDAPVMVQGPPMVELTPTDELFEGDRPSYYIYGALDIERKCWQCGQEYVTRMELNKFCSPDCKNKWLTDSFRSMRKGK